MPTFINVGHASYNKGKVTSKGFFIKRIGKTVYRRWGAIIIEGRQKKKLYWENGYPQIKTDRFKSEEEAQEFMRVSMLRRIRHGYDRMEGFVKII